MSSRIFGRTLQFKSLLAGAAVCAVSAVVTSSSWADNPVAGQAELTAALAIVVPTRTPTVNTATAAQLEAAVAKALVTGTVAPGDLAASALEPYPFGQAGAKVRADRNASGPGVVASALTELVTLSDPNFATDAAAVTQQVVDVNQPTTTANLTIAGQEAAVKSALGAISDAYINANTNTRTTLLAGDAAIGTALSTDANLTGLTKSGLTTILQTAIAGVTGLKGKSTA